MLFFPHSEQTVRYSNQLKDVMLILGLPAFVDSPIYGRSINHRLFQSSGVGHLQTFGILWEKFITTSPRIVAIQRRSRFAWN